MLNSLHKTRTVREIAAQARHQPGTALVLDGANDAWLYRDGEVHTRESGRVGNVSGLSGAARIASACKIVRADRRIAK